MPRTDSPARGDVPPVAEWRRIASVPLHPARVVAELAAALPADAIVCIDGPRIERWAVEGIPALATRGVRVVPIPGMGVPCAVGMKLARPDQPVLVLTDGESAARSAVDLAAAGRYGAPISLLIANDGGAALPHAPPGRPAPRRARYELLAEFAGGVGDEVKTPQQLAIALTNALASPVPAVIDAVVDPSIRYSRNE